MPNIQGSGTQTTAIGTEHILADVTSPFAVYQMLIDVTNMQTGDITELRCYTKVLSGGGLNSVLYQQVSGAPTGNGDQIWASLPIVSDQEVKFTLKQINGVGRNYPWKVVSFP